MSNIKLDLTIDEVNLILEGLGNLPFAKVYGLVGKIQEQASQQLNGQEVRATESPEPPSPPQVQETGDE